MFQWLKKIFGDSSAGSSSSSFARVEHIQANFGDPTIMNLVMYMQAQCKDPAALQPLELILSSMEKYQAGDNAGALQILDQVASMPGIYSHLTRKAVLTRGVMKVGGKDLQCGISELTSFLDEGFGLPQDNDWAMLWRGRARLQAGELEGATEDFTKVASSNNLNPVIPCHEAIRKQAERELQKVKK